MKTYGSAVLTALEAQHKSIAEVRFLIHCRRLDAIRKGANPSEWIDCFWRAMSLIESAKILLEVENK